MGFVQLRSDNCVYVHHEKQVIVSNHVDDSSLWACSAAAAKEVIDHLAGVFSLKPAELLNSYLGMEIDRLPNGDFRMHQQPYIERLLTRFGLADTNPSMTPLPPGMRYSKDQNSTPVDYPYRSMIGALLYASLGTRPDIAYAVSAMAQFDETPSKEHFMGVKRILRYLKGSSFLGIVFRAVFNAKGFVEVSVYSDSDWASDQDSRKSRSGYVVYVNGAPVAWMSKGQPCHALSSCEAEIIAMTEAIKECVWLRSFLSELGIKFTDPIKLYIDNESAKALSLNPVNHSGSKHIDLRYKYILEIVSSGFIEPIYVKTQDNIADIFTKSPTVAIFRRHMEQLVR
jgi:hypothetical protein